MTTAAPIRDRIVELRRVKASELQAHPTNWRIHPDTQRAAVSRLLSSIGYADALLAYALPDGSLRLFDGHLRKALTPDAEVPVLVTDLTEAEAAVMLKELDPLAGLAEADEGLLASLTASIDEFVDAGLLESSVLLGDLLGPSKNGSGGLLPGVDPDEVPASVPARCKRGEVWECGAHRVMCGDSTSAEDVGRLMGGERAALCLTDPPYGVGWDYESMDDTAGNLAGLIEKFLPLARETAPVALVTSGTKNHRLYPAPDWTLCWFVAAGTGVGPWGFACWQPILAYGGDPYLKRGLGSRPDGIALTETAPVTGHPCAKPVGLWSWLMERGSAEAGEAVYDPFLGSGTTLIAAEQLGRRCYGMDVEPKYIDIALTRFSRATGKEPRRVE